MKLPNGGCVAVDAHAAYHVSGFEVRAVDKTGAGDAFAGALATALVLGMPRPDALRFATAASAIAVTRYGSQAAYPDRAELEGLLDARDRRFQHDLQHP